MKKRLFPPHEDLHVVLLVFADGRQPDMYLIPSKTWLESPLPAGFSSRDYGPGHEVHGAIIDIGYIDVKPVC